MQSQRFQQCWAISRDNPLLDWRGILDADYYKRWCTPHFTQMFEEHWTGLSEDPTAGMYTAPEVV